MILFVNTHNDIGLKPMILLAKARNDNYKRAETIVLAQYCLWREQ